MYDLLSFGVIQIKMDRRIIYTNKKASEIIEHGDVLYADNGILRSCDNNGNDILDNIFSYREKQYVDYKYSVMRIPRKGSTDYLLLIVFNLHICLNIIIKDLKDLPLYSERILEIWLGLTPREAQLATLLASGISIETASEELKITTGTARTHIRHVFAKCGVRSQAELVAKIYRLLPPIDPYYLMPACHSGMDI